MQYLISYDTFLMLCQILILDMCEKTHIASSELVKANCKKCH